MRPGACPALLQALSTVLFRAGCPEDLWINYRKLQKCKSSGRASWWPEWKFLLYKVGDPEGMQSVCVASY